MKGRYVKGEDINRVNALAREQTARIAALDASVDMLTAVIQAGITRIDTLEAAARALVGELCDQTAPSGTTLWCDWCDGTPVGSTDPRCEERAPLQHFAECPVGMLAALVLPVEEEP